jgi:hypothetical protein
MCIALFIKRGESLLQGEEIRKILYCIFKHTLLKPTIFRKDLEAQGQGK